MVLLGLVSQCPLLTCPHLPKYRPSYRAHVCALAEMPSSPPPPTPRNRNFCKRQACTQPPNLEICGKVCNLREHPPDKSTLSSLRMQSRMEAPIVQKTPPSPVTPQGISSVAQRMSFQACNGCRLSRGINSLCTLGGLSPVSFGSCSKEGVEMRRAQLLKDAIIM